MEAVCEIWPEAREIRLGWRKKVMFLRSRSILNGERIRVSLTIPGMRDRLIDALRRWLRLGGVPLLRRIQRTRRARGAAEHRAKLAKELSNAREGIRNFQEGRSCSGGVLRRWCRSRKGWRLTWLRVGNGVGSLWHGSRGAPRTGEEGGRSTTSSAFVVWSRRSLGGKR